MNRCTGHIWQWTNCYFKHVRLFPLLILQVPFSDITDDSMESHKLKCSNYSNLLSTAFMHRSLNRYFKHTRWSILLPCNRSNASNPSSLTINETVSLMGNQIASTSQCNGTFFPCSPTVPSVLVRSIEMSCIVLQHLQMYLADCLSYRLPIDRRSVQSWIPALGTHLTLIYSWPQQWVTISWFPFVTRLFVLFSTLFGNILLPCPAN